MFNARVCIRLVSHHGAGPFLSMGDHDVITSISPIHQSICFILLFTLYALYTCIYIYIIFFLFKAAQVIHQFASPPDKVQAIKIMEPVSI